MCYVEMYTFNIYLIILIYMQLSEHRDLNSRYEMTYAWGR